MFKITKYVCQIHLWMLHWIYIESFIFLIKKTVFRKPAIIYYYITDFRQLLAPISQLHRGFTTITIVKYYSHREIKHI